MKFRISFVYTELYYLLVSLLYFTTIRHMWFFRKVTLKTEMNYSFNGIKYFLVSLFVFFTIWVYKKMKLDLLSKNILGLILVIYFIPASIFYASAPIDPVIYLAHVLLFYSLLFAFRIRYNIKLPVFNRRQTLFILLAITLIGILPFLRYLNQINLRNLLLMDIYTTRFKFRLLFDTYSSYTHSWFTRVIIPIIFVFALKYKMRLLALFNLMVLIMLFLMGAVKSVILGSLLVVVFYFIPARKVYNYVLMGLMGLALVSIISIPFLYADDNIVAVIIFRRLMFIPGLLDYCYHDFFGSDYLYWSGGFLKGLLEYPYEESPARIIGELYFDRPAMAANNGLISDGFMNAGFPGVLVNIVLCCIFFNVIKNCNVDSRFFGIYFFFVYNIFTTTFSTVLLTHGGFLLLLLTLFMLRRKKESNV